jgi:hypothetical protein
MKDGDNGAVDTEQETTVNGANNGRINGGSEGGGNNSDNLANEEQPSNSSSDIAPDNLTESPESTTDTPTTLPPVTTHSEVTTETTSDTPSVVTSEMPTTQPTTEPPTVTTVTTPTTVTPIVVTENPSEVVEPTYPPGEMERSVSLSIFFILMLLGVSTILVHLMIRFKVRFMPESIAFLFIGFFVGLVLFIVKRINKVELQYQERFDANPFFLLLLPPIIFESGYSLHKVYTVYTSHDM